MNAYNNMEVSASQISEIFFLYENQIVNKLKKKYQISDIKESKYRNKSAKIELSRIKKKKKNIFGIKLHQKLSKLKMTEISECIKKDLDCK